MEYIIPSVLFWIRNLVKNPKRKEQVRSKMIEISSTINVVFVDDKYFATDVTTATINKIQNK
jgi:hypothetical protein